MGLEASVRPTAPIDYYSVFDQAKEISSNLPPIDPRCEAIAVVPVYREFSGGRIVDLLGEIEAQNVGSRRFETILVVNNPHKSDISDTNGVDGFLDNRDFLGYFRDQKYAGRFSYIHLINCTRGEISKRYMGLVRGLGQLVAEDRLDRTGNGDQGVIIQWDADVSIEPDFVSRLLEAYKYPDVYSAMMGRITLPIDFQGEDYYAVYASRYAEAVVSTLDGQSDFSGAGPTLSFRSWLHKKRQVREYIRRGINEDYTLGDSLANAGGMYLLAEPRVYIGDRIRPDGFDSSNRRGWVLEHASLKTVKKLLGYATDYTFPDIRLSEEQFSSKFQTAFWLRVKRQLEIKNPQIGRKLQDCLEREETLARRRMDWDCLDPQLKTKGLYLYALSRMAIGESQMLNLSTKK